MSAQNPSGTGIDVFNDPYNYQPYKGEYNIGYENYGQDGVSTGKSIWEKISRFFGGPDNEARYEQWKTERDREYERQATLSARAYDTWKENTKYQRMVEDLKKAGLNPWLALQGGISGSQGSQTAGSGSSARSHTESHDKTNLSGVAMLMMAVAKFLSVLA